MDEDRIVDGILICGIITIIILRICNVITWPWKWILAPIWIPLGIGVILALIFAIVIIIYCIKEKINELRN